MLWTMTLFSALLPVSCVGAELNNFCCHRFSCMLPTHATDRRGLNSCLWLNLDPLRSLKGLSPSHNFTGFYLEIFWANGFKMLRLDLGDGTRYHKGTSQYNGILTMILLIVRKSWEPINVGEFIPLFIRSIFFPIVFLSNLKVRDIAFCLPKHFLFQNTRVYRLNYLCFDRVVFLDAGTVVFPPFTFSQKFLQPLGSGELLRPRASKRPRWFQSVQWKREVFPSGSFTYTYPPGN